MKPLGSVEPKWEGKMEPKTATEWILLILLGGLAGAAGQMARVVIGLKKLNETAEVANVPAKNLIEPARLFTSLAIGFTAGALAAMSIQTDMKLTGQQVLALAATGYAGADFIEGMMSKLTPQEKALKESLPTGTTPQAARVS